MIEENFSSKQAKAQTREERDALREQEPAIRDKVQRIKDCTRLLVHFKDFLTEESWNARFDLTMPLFLEQVADTNMRIFLDMATDDDKHVNQHRVPKTKPLREKDL